VDVVVEEVVEGGLEAVEAGIPQTIDPSMTMALDMTVAKKEADR
jgi:hypothetical protein